MKFWLSFCAFLFAAVFLLWQSLFAFDQQIEVSNAVDVWTEDTVVAPEEIVNRLFVGLLALCLLAPRVAAQIEAELLIDEDLYLPNEALVCHADEILTNDLLVADIGDNVAPSAKESVLFVPGLLGTEMYKDETLLWASMIRMINPLNSDNFMDPLQFKHDLTPDDVDVFYGSVIKNPDNLYNYTDNLINEFAVQGYVEGKDFFTFPYDWRYGVSGKYPDGKTNSDLLRVAIQRLAKDSPTGKVDVIAHSLGGLITKKYIIDNDDPKINKLIFVGVPNLGLPIAAKALLIGHDFNVPGLSSDEIKKISQNMPAAYDLLPSESYFTKRGGYLEVEYYSSSGDGKIEDLLYKGTMLHLAGWGTNPKGIDNANNLHTFEFDSFDTRTKGIKTYNIVGCKSGTFNGIIDRQNQDLTYGNYGFNGFPISGDDTVPFESADSILADSDKIFYLPLADHGQMPSQDGVRQMISSIITGSSVPSQIIPYSTLKNDPDLCQVMGDIIEVHSPLDISVIETDNGKSLRLGLDQDGNIVREIPGASFEIINGHKYLYLPHGDGQQYSFNLQGTGNGTFNLIDKKIKGEKILSAQIFNDIPVTQAFSGSLRIEGDLAQIIPSVGPTLNPTSSVSGEAASDILAPRTTVSINGTSTKDYYNAAAVISLAAQDFAQEGVSPAGVFSISYALDGAATTTYQNAITVSKEGRHMLVYFSGDKLGNKEIPRTISFVIDKTPPELQFAFDQNKKDLVFSATDNYSASSSIVIIDQNGRVMATDLAGNTAQLSFNEKNRSRSLRAQLTGLSYNGKAIDMAGNQLAFAWFYGYAPAVPTTLSGTIPLPAVPATLPKTGPLSFLLQQAKLKDGSFIVALFSNNKTMVLEYRNKKLNLKTVSGLKLIGFATEGGKLGWSW